VNEAGPGPRVAIVVGSRSDVEVVGKASRLLDELGVGNELRVISAHRAPALLGRYLSGIEARGVRVVIAAAGLAAHLPGVVASHTSLPVIGIPMPGNLAGGLDALLSIVQMPRGVPVATVGIGMAENAALLAAQILGVGDPAVRARVDAVRAAQTKQIEDDPSNAEDARGE
jgi:phosphoribosylaminoimidazole carboxylase PurE protein